MARERYTGNPETCTVRDKILRIGGEKVDESTKRKKVTVNFTETTGSVLQTGETRQVGCRIVSGGINLSDRYPDIGR